VSVGRMESYIVGGFGGGQWLHTLTGPPISQITDCIDQAKPGQVVISRQCVAVLRCGEAARVQGQDDDSTSSTPARDIACTSRSLLDILAEELDVGAHSLLEAGKFQTIRWNQLDAAAQAAEVAASALSFTMSINSSFASDVSAHEATVGYGRFAEKIREYSESWHDGWMVDPQRSLKSALQSFAPAPVLRAIRSGSASSGELRRLTILFLHLDPPQEDSGRLQKIQHVCGIIQREVGGDGSIEGIRPGFRQQCLLVSPISHGLKVSERCLAW